MLSKEGLDIAKPRKLHLIDQWLFVESQSYANTWYGSSKAGNQEYMDNIYAGVANRFANEIDAGVVTVHRKPSSIACSDFPNDYFDWVYIDGDHFYEGVKKDLEEYFPKVKKGGYISGDDYVIGGLWSEGVKRAVDEFINTGKVKILKAKRGQYVLQKT